MTAKNVAAAKAIAELAERRSQIAAKLADSSTRLSLQQRLRQALKALERDGLDSLELTSIQQKIAAELGLPCFEVRIQNFEGPLKGGKWLRRTDAARLKESPWEFWGCGAPEPDVPVACVTDPIEGTTAVIGIHNSEKATTAVKNCIQDWLDEIEHLDTVTSGQRTGSPDNRNSTSPRKVRHQWPTDPPPKDSKFIHGPVQGQIKDFAQWLKRDDDVLRNNNTKTVFYIQKQDRTNYRIWFSDAKQYADINQKALAKAAQTRPKPLKPDQSR